MKTKSMLSQFFLVLLVLVIISILPLQAAAEKSSVGDATIGFTSGTLSLDSVPNLDFGESHPLPMTDTTYNSIAIAGSIQVSDGRGTGEGWRLTVKLADFANAGYPIASPLAEAMLHLAAPEIESASGTISGAPIASEAIMQAGGTAGQPVIQASAHTGGGTWQGIYKPDDAALEVFGGTAYEGSNVADMTWTLFDAP